MNDFLTVLGALELVILGAAVMFGLSCLIVRLNDRAEARRRAEDAADFAAQLTAMDADETRRWREWAGSDAGFLFASPEFVDSSPIYTEVLVEQMRRDLADWGKGDVA